MKRTLTVLLYVLFPALGLIWVIGCSSSTGPAGGGQATPYEIDIYVQPAAVPAVTGQGIVYCFLTRADTLVAGKSLIFHAVSEDVSNANLLGSAASSDTAETGTVPKVNYFPNDYALDYDTIYVWAKDGADTIAWDSTVVEVIQP